MFKPQLVQDKLELIRHYCGLLDQIFALPLPEIKADFLKLYASERLLQLIVDEMIDINNHIIREHQLHVPDDFQGTFETLATTHIVPHELAERIAPVVGLRNRLVHRYEELDKLRVLEQIQKERNDFKEYLEALAVYLEKLKKRPGAR